MKILFDHQIFINQKIGGISRYITDLKNGLEMLPDTECRISASLSGNHYLENSIDITKFPLGKRTARLWNQMLIKHRFMKAVDIVHPTYYNIKYLSACIKPVIITVHDLIYFRYPQYFPDYKKVHADFSYAIKRCDGIICISSNTKKELAAYFDISSKPVTVIHHGIQTIAEADSLSSGRFDGNYFLYIGSRHLYKNFSILRVAFTQFLIKYPFYKLIVVGGEPVSDEEQSFFTSYPDNVIRLPFVNDRDLHELYKASKALIITSFDEGFCYPAVEALLAGTELICSDISVLREVAGVHARYFDPYDADVLFNRMMEIAQGSDKINIDEKFKTYYHLDRMCNDTRQFYNTFR